MLWRILFKFCSEFFRSQEAKKGIEPDTAMMKVIFAEILQRQKRCRLTLELLTSYISYKSKTSRDSVLFLKSASRVVLKMSQKERAPASAFFERKNTSISIIVFLLFLCVYDTEVEIKQYK